MSAVRWPSNVLRAERWVGLGAPAPNISQIHSTGALDSGATGELCEQGASECRARLRLAPGALGTEVPACAASLSRPHQGTAEEGTSPVSSSHIKWVNFLFKILSRQFEVHSRTEKNGQRFLICPPTRRHMHSLPHHQHPRNEHPLWTGQLSPLRT